MAYSDSSLKTPFNKDNTLSKDDYNVLFYSHPSDNRRNILVSTPLDGENYSTWVHAMQMALIAKNKLGFVDGYVPQPDAASSNRSAWSRCNTMVLSWLINSISRNLRDSIIYAETSSAVWTNLCERFSQGNAAKIYRIRRDIMHHQQNQSSVSVYYTKLEIYF
ncbi:hypothetical protein MRB53_030379 [Persea americana]|uniref:Uncharacterized protein n=1 Tax=Persea americana TaxID=3435 RepID=A0ACC2KLI8_PERAE|nr:hypothetical protein MRB53_030379 [Persea americana]